MLKHYSLNLKSSSYVFLILECRKIPTIKYYMSIGRKAVSLINGFILTLYISMGKFETHTWHKIHIINAHNSPMLIIPNVAENYHPLRLSIFQSWTTLMNVLAYLPHISWVWYLCEWFQIYSTMLYTIFIYNVSFSLTDTYISCDMTDIRNEGWKFRGWKRFREWNVRVSVWWMLASNEGYGQNVMLPVHRSGKSISHSCFPAGTSHTMCDKQYYP